MGAKRYRLLETLREYGQERLVVTGEAEVTRGRHADYFLMLAEQVEFRPWGYDQTAWLDRLAMEHDNLRAALGWFADNNLVEQAVRLEDVAKATSREYPNARAGTLQECVDANRRAMREVADMQTVDPVANVQLADTVDHCFDGASGRRLLEHKCAATPLVHRQQVGERAANVDADTKWTSHTARAYLLPLPLGEGWGEGRARADQRHVRLG